MAVLTASRTTKSKDLGALKSYPAGVDILYAGGMIMINSAGFAVPAVAAAGNKGVVGVATKTVDNSGGSAGDLEVVVQEGTFLFAATSVVQGNLGSLVYASDDETVDETQGANEPVAGILEEFVSATECWVQISLSNSKHA